MTSQIDPTEPPQGDATTAALRANFAAAKAEIEELQAMIGKPPLGTALPSLSKTVAITGPDRIIAASGEIYQRIPGSLFAIADAVDQAFADSAPHWAAIVDSAKTFTTTQTAQPTGGTFGRLNAQYAGVMSSVPTAYTSNHGVHVTDSILSAPTLRTAQNYTLQATLEGIEDALYTEFKSIITTFLSTATRINYSADGIVYTQAITLSANQRYRLAYDSNYGIHVAAASLGGILGYIATSNDGATWTKVTPSGFSSSSTVLLAFFCPTANDGAGAFVYLTSATASTSANGYTAIGNANHGISLSAMTGWISQTRHANGAACTVIATNQGIYRTVTGLAYTQVSTDTPVALWNRSGVLWGVLQNGTLIKSTDDGLTWTQSIGRLHDSANVVQTLGRSLIVGARFIPETDVLCVWFRAHAATPAPNAYAIFRAYTTPTHIGALRETTTSDANVNFYRVR